MSIRRIRLALPFFLLLALCLSIFQPVLASASSPLTRPSASLTYQRALRVAVQVGHYKNNELPEDLSELHGNTGTSGGGRTEVDLNMDVANRIARLLRAQGIMVDVLPATVPTGYTADAFVAIHADGNSSRSPRGFKISTRYRSSVAVQDALLVEMLTEEYARATGLPEDSAVTRNMRGYYAYAPWRPKWRISNYTPGAIVELGFMTNAVDRTVMFNQTDRLSIGVVGGLMRFLKAAYGTPSATQKYGYGMVDKDIDVNAKPQPHRRGPMVRVQEGDWQVYLMGKALINAYGSAGGGGVVTKLPKNQFLRSTLRSGDYYRVTLPGGRAGWVHRNGVIIQM